MWERFFLQICRRDRRKSEAVILCSDAMRSGAAGNEGVAGNRRAGFVPLAARSDHRHEACAGEARASGGLALPGATVWRGLHREHRLAAKRRDSSCLSCKVSAKVAPILYKAGWSRASTGPVATRLVLPCWTRNSTPNGWAFYINCSQKQLDLQCSVTLQPVSKQSNPDPRVAKRCSKYRGAGRDIPRLQR